MTKSRHSAWLVSAVLMLCTAWPSVAVADGMNTYVLDMKFRQLLLDDAVPFAASRPRSTSAPTTRSPRRSSASTIAKPMPPAAPVTTATRPAITSPAS